jgi:hypothetical protein
VVLLSIGMLGNGQPVMGTVPATGHVKQESEVYRTATTWYAAVEMVRSEWKSHNFGRCVNHLHARHKSLMEQIFSTHFIQLHLSSTPLVPKLFHLATSARTMHNMQIALKATKESNP